MKCHDDLVGCSELRAVRNMDWLGWVGEKIWALLLCGVGVILSMPAYYPEFTWVFDKILPSVPGLFILTVVFVGMIIFIIGLGRLFGFKI